MFSRRWTQIAEAARQFVHQLTTRRAPRRGPGNEVGLESGMVESTRRVTDPAIDGTATKPAVSPAATSAGSATFASSPEGATGGAPAATSGSAVGPAVGATASATGHTWHALRATLFAHRRGLATLGVAGAGIAALAAWPPVHRVGDGAVAVRINQFSGESELFGAGPMLALPLVHTLREYTLRERLYRPEGSRQAAGEAPFQSVEGLSIGVELAVRWALDPAQIARIARTLPADIDGEIVKPAVQAVAHEVFARHTVREIFSARRAEIQKAIEAELKTRLAADGVQLRGLMLGPVNLPPEYRAGLDRLLAEELATEKMRYTLELQEKRVRETTLVAEAEKARRLTQAAAAAQEQIIAARAQEEAMRHVLPFKTQQIQQRQLEAEAEKVARIRAAEGAAQARRIEAAGEADSRRKLAEAEAERMERIGKVASAQMARDGELLHRHPLLIQKTMADKLSDKIQVIIAPPSASGGFVAASLLGGALTGAAGRDAATAQAKAEDE